MPTYDYVCDACGHALEVFHSISAAPRRKCPKCGKPKLSRKIGAGAGFLFKGGGFYKTDYRSSEYKAAAKAESGASAPATDGAKTEAAPSGDKVTQKDGAQAKPASQGDTGAAKKETKSGTKPDSGAAADSKRDKKRKH